MRRRPSGSLTDEDDEPSGLEAPVAPGPLEVGDKTNDTLKDPRKLVRKEEKSAKGRRKKNDTSPKPSEAHTTPWKSMTLKTQTPEKELLAMNLLAKDMVPENTIEHQHRKRARWRNPWAISLFTLLTTAVATTILFVIVQSFFYRQLDTKGCEMSWVRPRWVDFPDFDTEHTRFASKYSLHLYREAVVDKDDRVKGVPVLFIPGNAGSYRQVRPFADEASIYFHDVLQHDQNAIKAGKRALDFFAVDFNEDITAFHGQTLLDQAEYLNDAVAYILSLYHDPKRSMRDTTLPDPSSVIIVGHSMGGVVARAMLTMTNYQSNSINTIITLSAPHARAPVSFDADIVNTYRRINDYWRSAYAQKWANDNPLWHVTLISIAGGGLDTIVPSDYSSLASLIPDTHGFTVFTSSIPNVWVGMDHLAIMWCNQFRKSVVRALYDVIDVGRPVQTRPRAERMRIFKRWFLTGLEDVAEKTLPQQEPKTLLTLEDDSNAIISQGERLNLRHLGQSKRPKAYLLPIPPQGSPEGRKFTFLTNHKIDASSENGKVEVLFCSVFPLHAGSSAQLFSMNMDFSGDSTGSTRLACKNSASDTISLPASTRESKYAFETKEPFSYLQYDLEDLAEHQFIAIVDKATVKTPGWVVAEFNAGSESIIRPNFGMRRLLAFGLKVKLPAKRPLLMDIKIPAIHSSLLAYHMNVGKQVCGDEGQLFTPLVRQYISEVYESKFFVNMKSADINLHGVAPYMPPAFKGTKAGDGLALQIWSDPTCESSMTVSVRVDVLGSMGKLWMRYRTIFAAFPLLVVALVLRKQFKVYDDTGIFMSFSEGVNQCLRGSLPLLFLALTILATSLANASQDKAKSTSHWFIGRNSNATESFVDYTKNDLLLGSQDSFFWFLVPLFGLICIGICVILNYVTLGLIHIFALLYGILRPSSLRNDDGRRTPGAFAVTSTRQRLITTSILLLLVSTVIPYQFAYVVLCVVQLATSIRAYRLARESRSETNYNFCNYVHSLLILMLWILPINMPVLVVWIRNLAVHWLTPFSTHHNILSITPFILLVETLSTGIMIPRVTNRLRYCTNILLFGLAIYAAIYGATYAYLLHQLANILYAWLITIHFSTSSFSLHRLTRLLEGTENEGLVKKRP
ncbi:GPI inositol-deacylase-like protein [Patellaria atrata CBS 101060]|uniref:GPI inositol-deacylase n=1 Tax=Patellaria atrata CBS 101060 TaxID=1346257 RepID=A0A9P4VR69_9PEZI|nr:GPI inositol-deacylase-like protein [Patellaria atrata CBS 101060]